MNLNPTPTSREVLNHRSEEYIMLPKFNSNRNIEDRSRQGISFTDYLLSNSIQDQQYDSTTPGRQDEGDAIRRLHEPEISRFDGGATRRNFEMKYIQKIVRQDSDPEMSPV